MRDYKPNTVIEITFFFYCALNKIVVIRRDILIQQFVVMYFSKGGVLVVATNNLRCEVCLIKILF